MTVKTTDQIHGAISDLVTGLLNGCENPREAYRVVVQAQRKLTDVTSDIRQRANKWNHEEHKKALAAAAKPAVEEPSAATEAP